MLRVITIYIYIYIYLFIIWQAPQAGKMNQILRCEYWLPERAGWSDTARSGLAVLFLQ